jgi:2-oxo-hept-3-ene-1,7-dioate hydratase
MGHPAAGIAWLVNKLHAVGARLEKGQIVLAGLPPSASTWAF